MARETKYDDLRGKRICDALRKGHSYAAAARAGGIDEATLHRWRALGRDGDERYRAFCERVDQADQAAEDRAVQVLQDAMGGEDMRLAADTAWKWLARRRPTQWQETKGEEPLTAEEAERLVAEAAQLIAAGGKP